MRVSSRGSTKLLHFSLISMKASKTQSVSFSKIRSPFRVPPIPVSALRVFSFQSAAVGKHLVDPKSKTVFPNLKRMSFWKGLSFKDIDNATSYLQQKLDSVNTETVSFFGISVNKTVSVWAAPLACLSIEWFFLW